MPSLHLDRPARSVAGGSGQAVAPALSPNTDSRIPPEHRKEAPAILIVEDEGLIALDLRQRIERAGYSVPAIAKDGPTALRMVERFRPSLILMDIRLSGPMDGIEAADQIRRRFRTPVMYVTAHADTETLERAKITEPFGYIVKPFPGVDFRAQIEMALWKHRMELRLRLSEAWLSTTFRNVADALIATDVQGNVAFMNAHAARLTGWEPAKAKGKPLLDVFQVFDEATRYPVVHPLDAIYDGRQVKTDPASFRLVSKARGPAALIEAEMSANHATDGELLGVIVVFRDITERRRHEEKDRTLERMNAIASLAAGLGREMADSQNRMEAPLTSLMANAKGRELGLVSEIHELASQQNSLVRQLNALGGTDPGDPTGLDVNEIIEAMQEQFRTTLGKGRALKLTLEPNIPVMVADRKRLEDSLLRLIIDARQALPDEGEVEIATKGLDTGTGKRQVQVLVHDDGKPVGSAALPHVFDPYNPQRPVTGAAAGFSLTLVYQFVTRTGGNVEVLSSQGRGRTFVLSFPAMEDSPLVAA